MSKTSKVFTWCGERDLAITYALTVLVVAIFLHDKDGRAQHEIVLRSSTNVANLRQTPIYVLAVSAFVIPSTFGLWVLAPLVVAFGEAQRWVGRLPTLTIAVIGHVLATLFVSVLLTAGLTHGRLAASVTHEPDVGVSYALATIAAFLTVVVPHKWKVAYVGGLLLIYGTPVLFSPNFTDVGHLTSLATGFAFSLVAQRSAHSGRLILKNTHVDHHVQL